MRQFTLFILSLAVMSADARVGADLTKSEKAEIKAIRATIKVGGTRYLDENYEGSAKKMRRAQIMYQKLSRTGDDEVMEALAPLKQRLVRARELLLKQGITLPKLKTFAKPEEEAVTDGDEDSSPRNSLEDRMSGPSGGDEFNPEFGPEVNSGFSRESSRGIDSRDRTEPKRISFTKQVVPILISRCGTCHIEDSKSEFQMASYAALLKGPPNGRAIIPRKPGESRLIEMIESGEMPAKGEVLAPEQVQLFKDWIHQGAQFDGKERSAKLKAPLVAPSAKPVVPGDPAS